jgi:hypothetical protein
MVASRGEGEDEVAELRHGMLPVGFFLIPDSFRRPVWVPGCLRQLGEVRRPRFGCLGWYLQVQGYLVGGFFSGRFGCFW